MGWSPRLKACCPVVMSCDSHRLATVVFVESTPATARAADSAKGFIAATIRRQLEFQLGRSRCRCSLPFRSSPARLELDVAGSGASSSGRDLLTRQPALLSSMGCFGGHGLLRTASCVVHAEVVRGTAPPAPR
jgi:hypothetical protein